MMVKPSAFTAPATARESSALARFARRIVGPALLALILPVLTQCEAWEEAPPPSTAANAVQPSADPGAPLPPGPPIPPADGSTQGAAGPDDDAKYVSGDVAIGADTDSYADADPAALNDFRAPLEPYGTWTDDSTYGTVWTPAPSAVGPDFTPYVSSGHWAYDDDYVWVSDYSWGWAPFHYGRWVFADGRGWMWIPGREYRGAWVTWSVDDGYSYLGWAPMGPSFVWFGGVPVGYRGYWGPRWAYVPRGDVFAPRVGARVIVGPSAVGIGGRMRPYTVAEGHIGPPPARFGYRAEQIPRVTGNAAVSVSRAQQYARPSTARPRGASAPARVESRPSVSAVQPGRPRFESSRPTSSPAMPQRAPGPTTTYAPRPIGPSPGGAAGVGRVQATPAPAPVRAPAAPVTGGARPGGSFHGGGGHHR
jgi:hypothetical protein